MHIFESDLNTLLEDPEIIALALVGRPPKNDDNLVEEINGTPTRVNISDIYFFRRPNPDGTTASIELHKDQLALPVGSISGGDRRSAKPVLSTPRRNTIVFVNQ